MFAEETELNQPDTKAMAMLSIGLAPADPMTHWLKVSEERQAFDPELQTTLPIRLRTLSVLPYDFRWWIELGRANEQAERMDAAEKAFLRARRSGPAYSFPKWQLGNFYLRRGRIDEAFAKLRATTEKNSVSERYFRSLGIFTERTRQWSNSLLTIRQKVRRSLAVFYAQRGASADALRNWNLLTDEQKRPTHGSACVGAGAA